MNPMNTENQIGRLEGVLHETVTRIDRLEHRQEDHAAEVLALLNDIKRQTAAGVWLGALAGAFAGAVTGGMVAIFAVQWLLEVIERAAQ